LVIYLRNAQRRHSMDKFLKLIEFILKHEGYGNNSESGDLGGKTIWGISYTYHPLEVKSMSTMTPDEAKECAKGIYYREYWCPMNCSIYSDKVALCLLDSAVNCGVDIVKGWLQKIVASFNGNPSIVTAHELIFYRQQHYCDIIRRNPSQIKFFVGEDCKDGWIQRSLDTWWWKP